ncbi:GNAT family N-acetyltransferase [Morganella psychrotolerans]|uniref:GNAT family N-acetyltransferase n=1 Tax=Morganella psychrotolerans TaxID=368603 RepID=A0A5M9R941_9GAMM|nr:GNAT family N-acetyltransferase [Morganella psychrotolerans]KAA8717260.1 GNAT family N-acetyltransferase [Morganella psychrotolerans]OBU08452.1 hypothetical protein AYY16_03825 [Morganella psychrotolerans]
MTALLTLQPVTPDEITVLSDAGDKAYRHHFTGYWDSVAELNTYLNNEYHPEPLQQSLATPGVFWFFICADEKIIGFCKLTENSRAEGSEYCAMLLNKLYFLPGETGKSYGKTVFGLIETFARSRNQPGLWLEVLENNTGAQHFYQSQGMIKTGTLAFETTQQSSQLFIMEKKL